MCKKNSQSKHFRQTEVSHPLEKRINLESKLQKSLCQNGHKFNSSSIYSCHSEIKKIVLFYIGY